MPSRANTSATSRLPRAPPGPRIRSPTSSTVTRTPNRASAWASSAPIGPPPMTTSEPGTDSIRRTSRLVQYGVSASPSIGGARRRRAGVEHDAARRLEGLAVHLDRARPGEPAVAAHEPAPRRPRAGRRRPGRPSRRWPRRGSGRATGAPVGPHVGRRPRGRRSVGPRRARRPRGSSSCSGCSRSRGTHPRPAARRPRPPRARPSPAPSPSPRLPARVRPPPRRTRSSPCAVKSCSSTHVDRSSRSR